MHIPDNYLSVSTCLTLAAATVPVWTRSIKTVARDFPRERFSALGVAAAFSFLAMMFNVPLPGGTTGHAVGGTLLAALLGPEAACLALSIALLLQALLFGDGGVLAFGANCFNIAFILPFSGYYSYLLFRRLLGSSAGVRNYVALALGSYLGINVAALVAGVEFGLQPLLFHNAEGQALYCPYPLGVATAAMAVGHLTVFGLAEVVFTLASYAFIERTSPQFATNPALTQSDDGYTARSTRSRFNAIYLGIALLVLATPLGLLAEGTAWGEWGTDEIAEVVVDGQPLGYTPEGMTNGFQWNALVPDYAAPGMPEWLSYILSAIAGVACSIIIFKLLALCLRRPKLA